MLCNQPIRNAVKVSRPQKLNNHFLNHLLIPCKTRLFCKYGGSLNIRSPLPKLDASTLQHMKKPESLEELYHSGQDRLVDLTPLSLMIYAQNWRALKFLVQNGADPNFCDKLELSPMMHAVKQVSVDKNI